MVRSRRRIDDGRRIQHVQRMGAERRPAARNCIQARKAAGSVSRAKFNSRRIGRGAYGGFTWLLVRVQPCFPTFCEDRIKPLDLDRTGGKLRLSDGLFPIWG